jgi:hypothetical protein
MHSKDLMARGFILAGRCSLDERLKGGVRFVLTGLRTDRVIYSFTLNDKVRYIGVCDNTSTSFADRMSRYQGLMGAGTNKRIVELMRAALAEGQAIDIYAWRPNQEVVVEGLSVDLVKGMENPLIGWAQPEWNIKG